MKRLYNHRLYLAYWIVNFIAIYFLSFVFPENIVTGNWRFSPAEAAIFASFWLTFSIWIIWDFLYVRGVKFPPGFSTWMYFWVVNTAAIWIIARVAHIVGLGLSGWEWAVVLGLVANWMQRIAWRFVTRRELKV